MTSFTPRLLDVLAGKKAVAAQDGISVTERRKTLNELNEMLTLVLEIPMEPTDLRILTIADIAVNATERATMVELPFGEEVDWLWSRSSGPHARALRIDPFVAKSAVVKTLSQLLVDVQACPARQSSD